MPFKRSAWRAPRPSVRVGLALGAAVIFTLSVLVVAGNEGDAGPHRVASGGFELTLPRGWTTTSSDDPARLFRASWQRVKGFPTAWLSVSRWTAVPDSMDDGAIRESIAAGGGEVAEVSGAVIDGRSAKSVRYNTPMGLSPEWLPKPRLAVVAYYVEAYGHVFRIAFSSWPQPPMRHVELVVSSLRLFEPEGWRTVRRADQGFSMELPAGWNASVTDLVPGVLLTAVAASDPPDSWVYVFRGGAGSVPGSLEMAKRNIEAEGGRILDEGADSLGGRPATRLDLLFPNTRPGQPMIHTVEWFVEDNRAGVLILAVAGNDPASGIAEEISKRFVLL